jgi:hypothetical protein
LKKGGQEEQVGARNILVRIILLSLVALSGFPAAGQSMMDREGPPPRAHPVAVSSPAEVLRAAACVAGSASATGAAVLASTPQSPGERRATLAFLREGERCLHLARRLVTSIAILRGAAAESLYEAQFAAPVVARTPAIAAAPMPRPAGAPAYVNALAECVAATRQDLVRALLSSDPATPAEETALQAFSPIFESCATPGIRMEIGSRELRGQLAEALYRWSVVQRDGPNSPLAAASSTAGHALTSRESPRRLSFAAPA